MKIFTKLFFFSCLLLISIQAQSQISFTNQNALLNGDNFSGVAIGVTDVNGDMLDDIVRMNQGNELNVQYQTPGGGQFTEYYFGVVSNGSQWMLTAADCNNNGFADFMTGDYTHSRYITSDATGLTYSSTEFPGDDFFAQAANFADINNDGFLDAFICNDDGESFIYRNTGTGSFEVANEWIDMSIDGSSGEPASGNYGSIWTDFDNDGDTDLYIAKCRQGVSSQTDERRINKLFVNDGNNNYTEMGEEYGLRIGYQSWTAEFNDIDNDGDYDCFITNHDFVNQLLENDGTGHFTDITAGAGLDYSGIPIQGIMRDFDNDGFLDIIVTGSTHTVYHNNGDKTFTAIENPFDDNGIESLAVGDLNHDGFVDIYAGYANIYTNPSNIPDVLWMNNGNNNNHFSVHLTGMVSNKDGVGARIEIYGDFGMQVREVRAGESYGISNSVNAHFGLGQSTAIDHMIVKWPSGIVDLIDNPTINECMEVIEGNCVPNPVEVTYNGSNIICPGESLVLTAPAGGDYYWSNGENTQEITVTSAGNYSVLVGNAVGCYDISQVVTVTYNPDETPTTMALGSTTFCEGGSVMLTASEASSYLWNNGMTEQTIEVTTAGNYTVVTPGLCGDFTSPGLTVDVLPPSAMPVADDVQVLAGEDATLVATGGNVLSWYDALVDGNLLATGSSYTVTNVTAPATYYVENLDVDLFNNGPASHQGSSNYSGNIYNGQVIFDALGTFKLNSVKVYTDTPGERIIELRDQTGLVVSNKTVDIPTGESRVDLGFIVEPGNDYVLTTNEESNLNNFGFESPRLQRTDENNGVSHPYLLENIVSITSSNYGVNRYYYFYDWEVQTPPVDCVSDRTEVQISLAVSAIDINETDAVNVFPNPGNGLINIELSFDATDVKLMVTSIAGQQLLQRDLGKVSGQLNDQLDLRDFAKGSYLLQVQTEENTYFTKLILN